MWNIIAPLMTEISASQDLCINSNLQEIWETVKQVKRYCYCFPVAKSWPTLCDPIDCSTPGSSVLHYLTEFAQTQVHWVGHTIQPSHPVAPSSPSLNLSRNRYFPTSWLFTSGGQSIGTSASVLPMNIQLISFRIDWFNLFSVQGTLKSLHQHHNSKASILWCSAFFMVQLSHPYMTTGKTITLTIRTFVSKGMNLLFTILSRFVIAFLPRSKLLLISWLQSPFAWPSHLQKPHPNPSTLKERISTY